MMASRPWMNEELEMLRDTARRFFERECVPHEQRWREQHHADREHLDQGRRRPACCAPASPRNTAAAAAASCTKP